MHQQRRGRVLRLTERLGLSIAGCLNRSPRWGTEGLSLIEVDGAFSPGENFLYVGNWDGANDVRKRYPVNEDGDHAIDGIRAAMSM